MPVPLVERVLHFVIAAAYTLILPIIITNAAVMKVSFDLLSHLEGREVNVWSPADDGWALLLVFPAALLVCIALSTPVVRWLCWPLVQPPLHLLVNDEMRNAVVRP